MMDTEHRQDIADIIESVRAIKGDNFVKAVVLATDSKTILGMIANTDMNQAQGAALFESALTTMSSLMAEIVQAYNLDHAEVMQWADRLLTRIMSSIEKPN